MPRDNRGVESLPITLLLGVVLGASAIAIGVTCLDRTQRLSERQRAIDSFNLLVEHAKIISAGGMGSVQLVELDLGDSSILVDGEHVQLLTGGAVTRSEIIPLQMSFDGEQLRSGSYLLELERLASGRYVIRVEEV